MTSTIVYIEDINDLSSTLNKICKCGHSLFTHRFTWDRTGEQQFLRVSSCLFCGFNTKTDKDVCEEFHSA